MQGVATEKVPGGKLLRIKVDYGERINDVKITGDFFIHPEESVAFIEKCLIGTAANEEQKKIEDFIAKITSERKIELIGIDAAAIARVLKVAMK
jgi:lipoate-protein ligase A